MKNFFNTMKDLFNSKGDSSEENLFPDDDTFDDAFLDSSYIDGVNNLAATMNINQTVYLKK